MISIPMTVEVIYANSVVAPQRLHACQCKLSSMIPPLLHTYLGT